MLVKGFDTIYLQWSAVDNCWAIQAPRDRKAKRQASEAWIVSKPVIRDGPGAKSPHLIPKGNWVVQESDKRESASGLTVLLAAPGQDADDVAGPCR